MQKLQSLAPDIYQLRDRPSVLWTVVFLCYIPFISIKTITFFENYKNLFWYSVQFSSVTQLRPTLCDPVDCSVSGLPVHQQLLELAQTHVHWVGDAIHLILCRPLLLPSIFPSIRVFSNESHQVTTYRSFSFSISPSNEYSGLISFRIAGLISLQSKGLSRVFSSTTVEKHQFFSPSSQLFSKHCLWWCEL